jgi:hypothetical protein
MPEVRWHQPINVRLNASDPNGGVGDLPLELAQLAADSVAKHPNCADDILLNDVAKPLGLLGERERLNVAGDQFGVFLGVAGAEHDIDILGRLLQVLAEAFVIIAHL